MNKKEIEIKLALTIIAFSLLITITHCNSMQFQSKPLLLGIYTTNISENENTDGRYSDSLSSLDGLWELSLYENGVYIITRDGKHIAEGQCIITDNQVIFTDERGLLACDCAGLYGWEFDGKTLSLTNIEDQCGKRIVILTNKTWINKLEF